MFMRVYGAFAETEQAENLHRICIAFAFAAKISRFPSRARARNPVYIY